MRAPLLTLAGVVIIAIIILVINHNDKKKHSTVSFENESSHMVVIEELDRTKLYNQWFTAAKDIAQKTKDPEAIEICEFIEKSVLLAEPHPNGGRFLQGAREDQKHYFGLVMMCKGDQDAGFDWRRDYYSVAGSGARFMPDGPMMIIKSHIPTSTLKQGLILLHEGRHARQFLTQRYNWTDAKKFCEEERDTHNFQNRITSALLGESYTKLVIDISHEYEKALADGGFKPGEALAHRSREFTEFDSIFPAISKFEQDFRDTSIWIHANFIMLERAFGAEAENHKAIFLFQLYKESGIVPNS
ncbi:MAG: hypothetical protein WC087_03745 [Candidatus Paceibacterota bacterium]